MSRYRVSGSEGQYEKNSGEQVLANKLGAKQSRIHFGYPRRYVNGLRSNVLLGWRCVETRLNSKAKMGELFARRFK